LAHSLPVTKEYATAQDGAQYLIEKTDYGLISQEAAKLRPLAAATKTDKKRAKDAEVALVRSSTGQGKRQLPVSLATREVPSKKDRAELKMRKKGDGHQLALAGYTIDFDLNAGNITNLVLQSDTTYYVKGLVWCESSLTIEGGSVTKSKDTTAAIMIDSG